MAVKRNVFTHCSVTMKQVKRHLSQAAEADVCTLGRAQWNPDAVARFGLSISLRKVDNKKPGGCGVVSQEALQLYVAAQWVLERLNADHGNGSYVPGVQFGFDLLDDCRSPTRALQYALDFADLNSDCRSVNDTSTNLKLGVVGPTRSSTAEETADAMRSLPFPIISPAATLASLTEGTTDHSNFFRTVPSDNLQTEVMVSILKRLHWTFVAIVYTSDNYGTMGARTLEKHARANNVCVDVSVPLIKGNGGMETVVSKLIEMRDRAESKSVAVVFIGEKDTAEFFVYNLKLRALFGFHFIMSDSVSTNTEVFNSGSGESTDFKNIALGSLTLVPSSVHLQDFEDYLNKKYRDVQDGIVRDPQIESWLQSLSQPWDRQRIKQIPFVPLTVGAIFALAEATRLAHEEMCGGEHGACQRLLDATRDGIILKHVKNITVDFSNMSDRVAPAKLKSLGYVLEFDEKGDVRPNPGLPDYSVYAFDDNNQPPYLNVGNYSTGNLKLDISSVHMYTWDGQMTRQLQTSVCMGSCPLCADNGKVPLAHLPGSAYIVGVFSVHERNSNNPFTCGDYRNVSTDVVVLEAFLHVVKQLRASTGVNFGAVAFDDCYSPLHMTSVLSDFLSGLVPFDKGLFDVCVPREKVVGVVGCLSSDSTLATASFFTPLHTPVISYAASSPDLDDKTSYPYFLRTVPSDEEQAVAMAELILAMGWEYVGLLHVSNNYGTKGAMAFQRAARARRLCVADPVKISPEPEAYDETYLDDQFTKLRQTGAKVVVFFGIDTRIADMLRLIEARNHQGQIIFISSEEWANKRDVLDAGYKAARGSITFKVDNVQGNTTMQNSFNQYLVRKSPSETDVNPWFSEFWQHMFDCNLAGGFNNIFDEVCKDSYRLSSDQVTKMVSDQRVQHVMNAVQALGQGLAAVSHSNTDTVCESSFPCDNLHDEAFAPQVLKVIKSQTLPSVTARRNRIFDDNGNGKIGFTIYNVQRKTNDDYDYVYVGSYDSDRGLQLQKESIVFYSETGVPKKSIDASCTDERCSASQCVFPSDVLPSPAPQTQDEKFRVADLVILIVLLAACLLLHYLNHHKLEDPLQSGQVQYQQQGDMEQIQYFRMTPSGQLEEEDEEEEEEEGVDEEEETAVLNTYSLSPPSSRANGTQYDGHVGNQPQSFPQTHYSGNLPSIEMTPELREMLLQQLAEDLLKQQHQQQQQQQELKQSLQSPSSSSLGSSSQDSMSSQAGKRRQKADQAQYQQQLSQPTSLVYPSSSSMSDNQSRSDSAMGSSHSSQPVMGTQGRQVPQYQKQVSTPVGTGYLSPASDHQSPRMVRYPQTQQAGISRSSPYAQLAQIQQQAPTDMSHMSNHQSTRIARDNQPQQAVIPHSSPYAQLAQIQQQVPGDMSPSGE
nr:hypothetical protein BaRGS_020056 [Batillaria attramentaria]